MIITIEDTVAFAPNVGVLLLRTVAGISPDHLQKLILLAERHMQDKLLVDCCCGGCGPLAEMERSGIHEMDIDNYLHFALNHQRNESAKIQTRSEFNKTRSAILAEMIRRGVPFACAENGCAEKARLTIDHIKPIYRGGSNEIENLQFMCRSHNSKKGRK